MSTRDAEYRSCGYLLLKQFLPRDQVREVLRDARRVFLGPLLRRGYVPANPTDEEHEAGMARLFQEQPQEFMNCGKHAQHLMSLHRLSLDRRIEVVLRELGLRFPNICTRPVLYFNHPTLAKKEVYWRVAAHQDWRSMQGSLDSVVVWVPLADIKKSLGALEIVPGSHKRGLLTSRVEDGFGLVDQFPDEQFLSVETEVGDALFFSSFLVHRSGTNVLPSFRWSCHFRYNNLDEETFIRRGYPHPYVYKPQDELITPDFPSPSDVARYFS